MYKQKLRNTLLLANFLHIFGVSMLAPMYALYGVSIDASIEVIGGSWGLYNLVGGVTNIISGRLVDGISRTGKIISLGYFVTLLALLMFLGIKHPSQLFLVQAIHGLGVGIYMPAWKSLYTRNEDRKKISSQWGIFDGGNMISMAVAATAAGLIVDRWSYKILFLTTFAFYTLAFLVSTKIQKLK